MSYYNPNSSVNFTTHFVSTENEIKSVDKNPTSDQWALCITYKLNKSGSKLITIGMDIFNDCAPFVNIGNSGMSVTLTKKGWLDLLLYKDYFDYYFETGVGNECWDLEPSVKFYASEVFQKRSIILHASHRVIMQETTWRGLKKLLPCIDTVLQQRISWEEGVRKYVDSVCQKLKDYACEYNGNDVCTYLKEKLNELPMPHKNKIFKHLDVELKAICADSIINKVLSN